MIRRSLIVAVAFLGSLSALAERNVNLTVRRAPYDVSNVSSKSEIAHKPCQNCGSGISYERKYRWNTVRHEWIETTKASEVPTICRKCELKAKAQKNLDTRERELDRKIKYEKTKSRLTSKEKTLNRLRNANR